MANRNLKPGYIREDITPAEKLFLDYLRENMIAPQTIARIMRDWQEICSTYIFPGNLDGFVKKIWATKHY